MDGCKRDDRIATLDKALTIACIANDEMFVVLDPESEGRCAAALVLGRLLDEVDGLVGLVEGVDDCSLPVRLKGLVREDVSMEETTREACGMMSIVSVIDCKEFVS